MRRRAGEHKTVTFWIPGGWFRAKRVKWARNKHIWGTRQQKCCLSRWPRHSFNIFPFLRANELLQSHQFPRFFFIPFRRRRGKSLFSPFTLALKKDFVGCLSNGFTSWSGGHQFDSGGKGDRRRRDDFLSHALPTPILMFFLLVPLPFPDNCQFGVNFFYLIGQTRSQLETDPDTFLMGAFYGQCGKNRKRGLFICIRLVFYW